MKKITSICFIWFFCCFSAQTEVCKDATTASNSDSETKYIRMFFAGTSVTPVDWKYLPDMQQLMPDYKDIIYTHIGNIWSYYFPGALSKFSLDLGNKYSIPNNAKKGVEIIKNNVYAISKTSPNAKINIDISGHSRGAVTAGEVATKIKKEYASNKNIKVNLVSLDPVPGPDRILFYNNLKLNVDNSVCVYSLNVPPFHQPQKLKGCKIIIINNTNHNKVYGYKLSGKTGDTIDVYFYKFNGKKYFLSQLSSLEPQIYFCKNFSELEVVNNSNYEICIDMIYKNCKHEGRRDMLIKLIADKLNL